MGSLREALDRMTKLAMSDAQASSHIRRRWGRIRDSLHNQGIVTGAGLLRVTVPKKLLTREDLTRHLGFVPVKVAVPETGQTAFESFRHPYVNYHVHEHGDQWTVHYDNHPSTTMLLHRLKLAKEGVTNYPLTPVGRGPRKDPGGLDVAKAAIEGMPHLLREGVPGMASWAKNQVLRGQGMADTVNERLNAQSPQYLKRLSTWRPSPTHTSPEPTPISKDKIASAISAAREMLKESGGLYDTNPIRVSGAMENAQKRHEYAKKRIINLAKGKAYRDANKLKIQRHKKRYATQVNMGARRQQKRERVGLGYASTGMK